MPSPPDAPMDLDRVCHVLRERPRRRVVRLLDGRDESTTLAALAAELAAEDARSADDYRTALHHKHLPLLDGYGVVSYQAGAGLVAPGPNLSAVRRAHDALVTALDGARSEA